MNLACTFRGDVFANYTRLFGKMTNLNFRNWKKKLWPGDTVDKPLSTKFGAGWCDHMWQKEYNGQTTTDGCQPRDSSSAERVK